MELDEIDPDRIAVTSVNERQEDLETDGDKIRELAESVNEVGVVQPVILRDVHDITSIDGRYDVVIGQRRVEAARRVNQTVPAVIMNWDDEEAIVASITENIQSLEQDVSTTDRAMALKRLWGQMGGSGKPDVSALSARLGVPRSTVSRWLEPLRDEWDGTDVSPETTGEDPPNPTESDSDSDTPNPSPDTVPETVDEEDAVEELFDDGPDEGDRVVDDGESEESDGGSSVTDSEFIDERDKSSSEIDVSEVSSEKIAIVRRMTGGGADGVRVLRRVIDEGLSIADVREISRRVDRGSEIEEAIEGLVDVKRDDASRTMRVHLSGERLAKLERVASDSGMSLQEATVEAVDMFLDEVDGGWFSKTQ